MHANRRSEERIRAEIEEERKIKKGQKSGASA
jgi:hypothetical protein